MGKKKIEMKKIEDKSKRMITFSKRRKTLFKKAADVCRLCDVNIALIVFSPAGKPFAFGHPSADAVIDRFLLTGTTGDEDHHQRMGAGGGEGDGFWWDNIDMEELDSIEKLQAVKNGLLGLKQNVLNRIHKLTSSSSSSSSSSSLSPTVVYTDSLSYVKPSNLGYHHPISPTMILDNATPAMKTTNNGSDCGKFFSWLLHDNVNDLPKLVNDEEADLGWPLEGDEWEKLLNDYYNLTTSDKLTSSPSSFPTVHKDLLSYVIPSNLDHHPISPTMILDNATPVLTMTTGMNSSDCGNFSSWLLDDDVDLPKLVHDDEADLLWPSVDEWEKLL